MRGIIFDLDGVIVHTDYHHYRAWKAVADRLGIPFDEQTNNRLRGVSRMESLDIILEKSARRYSGAEKIALATVKNEIYRDFLREMTPADVPAKTRAALSVLRQRGFGLAIGSSSKNAPLILARVGMAKYFDAVSDGNGLIRSKPDPEVFLRAAERLGLPAAECYVVEDALAGVEAGRRAGMVTIALGDAAEKRAGDHCIDSLAEVLAICRQAGPAAPGAEELARAH